MGDVGNRCKLSVDGTDCPIQEPQPFHPKYYSHKFAGPGLKYELGICIITGWACWFNGPFPCGNPDINIARVGLVQQLEPNEMVLADGGYRDGGVHFDTPTGHHNISQRMRSLCRARHETINGRMKSFRVLSTKFRHSLKKHRDCFHACLILTQVHIEKYDSNFLV
jgi:DDE superfamily endonuclease